MVIKGGEDKRAWRLYQNFNKAVLALLVLSKGGVALVELDFLVTLWCQNNSISFRFQMITLGGDAELELVDSLDPFSEGVVFSVRPPKKSWKNIANLSGGEKVLFHSHRSIRTFSF